jgi:hypothetical protein
MAFCACGRANAVAAPQAVARNGWKRVEARATPMPTTPVDDLPPVTAYPMPVIGLIEERVYDELEDIASQSIMGHRVLTQLSLSAFLYAGSSGLSRADEQRVIAHLASLQVDFLIVDADWQPVVAVNIERDAGLRLGRAGGGRRDLRACGRGLSDRECRRPVPASATRSRGYCSQNGDCGAVIHRVHNAAICCG